MRCDDVQQALEENGEIPALVEQHLNACAACRSYLVEWRELRAGFLLLAREPFPEPSLGFATRLARSLQAAQYARENEARFFEQIGRRAVLATLTLTLVLLSLFFLPTSGPMRAPGSAETYLAQPGYVAAANASRVTLFGEELNEK